jgi:hypothetical protein
MYPSHRLTALAALSLAGCVNPFNTRLPEVAPRSTQYEQAQARIQDPFPDAETGPDIGFRPLDFQQQRSEQMLSKEKASAAFLRQQMGVPGGGTAPGANGSMYPEAVRQ